MLHTDLAKEYYGYLLMKAEYMIASDSSYWECPSILKKIKWLKGSRISLNVKLDVKIMFKGNF